MQTALVEAARARIPSPTIDDEMRSAIEQGELPELASILCPHEDVAFGFRVASNAVRHLYVYCRTCLRYGGPISKAVYECYAKGDAPAIVSNSIPYGPIREWRQRAWRRKYNAYLESPEWRALRYRILLRDGFECRMELDGCTRRAVHVHHQTYERLGHEEDDDLLSVCRECHAKHHGHKLDGFAVRL